MYSIPESCPENVREDDVMRGLDAHGIVLDFNAYCEFLPPPIVKHVVNVWPREENVAGRELIIVSVKLSRIQHDVERDLLEEVYFVLDQYTAGVFDHDGV